MNHVPCTMTDDEKEYTIAASEALMIDYCNFVTTLLNSDNDSDNDTEKEKEEALRAVTVATNDTGTDEAVDTITDPHPQLMLFFRTLHKDSDRLYTERQRLLNLPLPLMVAATLSNLATATSKGEDTPQVRNSLFQRLQRVWMEKQHELLRQPKPRRRLQKNRAHQIRYFEWSPTLLLSLQPRSLPNHVATGTHAAEEAPVMVASDHQRQRTTNDVGTSVAAIATGSTAGCRISTCSVPTCVAEALRMHLIRRRDELMEQAALAQQQLFLLEATAVSKRNKSAKSQSQSKCNSNKPTLPVEPQLVNIDTLDTDVDSNHHDSTDDDDDDDGATNGSGNIDLASTHNTGSNHCNEDICSDVLSFRSQVLTEENGVWKEVYIRRKVPAIDKRTVEEADSTIYDVPMNISVNVTNIVSISNAESVDSEIVDHDQNSHVHMQEDTTRLHLPTLLNTIDDLKMQLQQMHQQRIADQQSAQKALQHERDVSYERIQELQLRLYISKTRLQTYEEALQHHVESVHRNIATTPTSINDPVGNVAATLGNMHTTQPETNVSAIGTPLYARHTTGETTTTNRLTKSDG